MKEEMMNDAIDDVMGDEDDDEERLAILGDFSVQSSPLYTGTLFWLTGGSPPSWESHFLPSLLLLPVDFPPSLLLTEFGVQHINHQATVPYMYMYTGF